MGYGTGALQGNNDGSNSEQLGVKYVVGAGYRQGGEVKVVNKWNQYRLKSGVLNVSYKLTQIVMSYTHCKNLKRLTKFKSQCSSPERISPLPFCLISRPHGIIWAKRSSEDFGRG